MNTIISVKQARDHLGELMQQAHYTRHWPRPAQQKQERHTLNQQITRGKELSQPILALAECPA